MSGFIGLHDQPTTRSQLRTFAIWRFDRNSRVYARGLPGGPHLVTARVPHEGPSGIICPHYLVVDDDGAEWMISQLELSSRALLPSTGGLLPTSSGNTDLSTLLGRLGPAYNPPAA